MKNKIIISLLMLIFVFGMSIQATTELEDDEYDNTRVLVVIKHEFSEINKEYSIEDFKCDNIKNINDLTKMEGDYENNELINFDEFTQILELELIEPGNEKVEELISQIKQLDFVESVSKNYITSIASVNPNDTHSSGQYALDKISVKSVWDYTTGDNSVKVGVIDSGIDATHPDLAANVDVSLGADFVKDGYGMTDPNGHGTHVAGIIGAVGNNSQGVAGVCWNIKMIPLRVWKSDGTGDVLNTVSAIGYAINHNITILNFSGGFTRYNDSLYKAIQNYKGIFIAAAGNANTTIDLISYYPASFNLDNIISVANTDENDQLGHNSNYGSANVDLGAPGEDILSTIPGRDYNYKSGTSMAAPQVTGAVALLKSYYKGATTEQLKWAILQGVDKCSSLSETVTGGRLNVYNSFMKLAEYHFVENRVVSGDFNGDGKDDIAGFYHYTGETAKLKVWLALGNGLSDPQNWYIEPSTEYNAQRVNGRLVAGDFNGDGKDDIAGMYDYGNNTVRIHVWLSNGSGFESEKVWYFTNGGYDALNVFDRMVAGDFNGDGKDDICSMYDYGNNIAVLHVWLSNGNGFTSENHWYNSGAGNYVASNVTGRIAAGDFNGDGRDDVCAIYDYGNLNAGLQVWLSTGSSFNPFQLWRTTGIGKYKASSVTGRVKAGDFNGDGRDDITAMYDYGSSRVAHHMYMSTGGSFQDFSSWFDSGNGKYSADRVGNRMITGDFNGDRKDDIATMYDYGKLIITIHTWKSTGISLEEMQEWYTSGVNGT